MAKASDFEGKKQDDLFYFVDYSPEEAERVGYSNYSYWGSVVQNFLKHKMAVVCLVLFLFLVIFSFIALAVGKYDYQTLITDSSKAFIAPNSEYWFGTDNLGRDVFSRVVYSARLDLEIGIFAMLIPAVCGTMIGLFSGYFGGKIDALIMRILDIFTAFPLMVLVIAIVAILGSGVKNLFIAIWLVGWREYAKLVRSEVLVVKNSEYVSAAKTLGYSNRRVIFRH